MTRPDQPDPAAELRAAATRLRNLPHPDDVSITLARLLDAVADEMTAVDGTEYAASEYPSWMAALAVARALLGGSDG